jgi:hypothetical protein
MQSDLLWSDLKKGIAEYQKNERDAGDIFRAKPVKQFLELELKKLKLITRSHQLTVDGLRWQFLYDASKKGRFQGQLLLV